MRIEEVAEVRRSRRGKWLDAAGWILFVLWIGAILIFKSLPDGAGSLGLGVLVLAGTLARLLLGVTISVFWMIIGLLFLVAGIGGMMEIDLPLLPLALIVCGILLLLHRRSTRKGGTRT